MQLRGQPLHEQHSCKNVQAAAQLSKGSTVRTDESTPATLACSFCCSQSRLARTLKYPHAARAMTSFLQQTFLLPSATECKSHSGRAPCLGPNTSPRIQRRCGCTRPRERLTSPVGLLILEQIKLQLLGDGGLNVHHHPAGTPAQDLGDRRPQARLAQRIQEQRRAVCHFAALQAPVRQLL